MFSSNYPMDIEMLSDNQNILIIFRLRLTKFEKKFEKVAMFPDPVVYVSVLKNMKAGNKNSTGDFSRHPDDLVLTQKIFSIL